MSLSADMQQRIEKSDAQEVVDEAQLKVLGKLYTNDDFIE